MSEFDILRPGRWFGEPSEPLESNPQLSASSEIEVLRSINRQLKTGDFAGRESLKAFILRCADESLIRTAVRLYLFTARNEDIGFIENIVSDFDFARVEAVVMSSTDCCSLHVVPYLMALHEDFADTVLGPQILHSLNMICPCGYEEGLSDPGFLIDYAVRFVKNSDHSKYYYGGELVFPGVWTKRMISSMMDAKYKNKTFGLAVAPTLLSIFSGIKCPIYHGDEISESVVVNVFEYVKKISSMEWIEGHKYFYGRLI